MYLLPKQPGIDVRAFDHGYEVSCSISTSQVKAADIKAATSILEDILFTLPLGPGGCRQGFVSGAVSIRHAVSISTDRLGWSHRCDLCYLVEVTFLRPSQAANGLTVDRRHDSTCQGFVGHLRQALASRSKAVADLYSEGYRFITQKCLQVSMAWNRSALLETPLGEHTYSRCLTVGHVALLRCPRRCIKMC